MRLLITGGRVIDPANGVDDILDVLVEEGQILQVGREGQGSGVRGKRTKSQGTRNHQPRIQTG